MGRTSLKHSIPLVAFLMSLALIGTPVIEFLFVAVVTIIVTAILFYAVLSFMYTVDRVFNYFYTER